MLELPRCRADHPVVLMRFIAAAVDLLARSFAQRIRRPRRVLRHLITSIRSNIAPQDNFARSACSRRAGARRGGRQRLVVEFPRCARLPNSVTRRSIPPRPTSLRLYSAFWLCPTQPGRRRQPPSKTGSEKSCPKCGARLARWGALRGHTGESLAESGSVPFRSRFSLRFWLTANIRRAPPGLGRYHDRSEQQSAVSTIKKPNRRKIPTRGRSFYRLRSERHRVGITRTSSATAAPASRPPPERRFA